MPELPEVETVRRGLAAIFPGRRIVSVTTLGTRTLRRQEEGEAAFRDWLTGALVLDVCRRGKYLWWTQQGGRPAVVAHLGMSGQFRAASDPNRRFGPHERVRLQLDDGCVLAFLDQRTFGWLLADDLVGGVPACMAHIAPDPFDPGFDIAATARRLRGRRTAVKRALLDQTVVSGIGNIYADEALWRARMHPGRAADGLSQRRAIEVLQAAREVMLEAVAAGGTSFDPLYVHVNGESGWFSRDLAVYGRAGEPCPRCGRPIIREAFTNRSSHRCPSCQRAAPRMR